MNGLKDGRDRKAWACNTGRKNAENPNKQIKQKMTENLYSSLSTVTLRQYYSVISKSTGARKILN